jgi:Family of unknown function (DUF6529)
MNATAAPQRSPAPRLLAVLAAGAAVAVAVGVYGNAHDPSQKLVFTLFFSSTIALKVWLATVAAALAVAQLSLALWIYGRLPWRAPGWAGPAHRITGRLAFLTTLPVAYHCLWSLGFQDSSGRVLAHSLLGCAFYGAFATKVLVVRDHALPGRALPIAGGVIFATLIALWYTSALWFVRHNGGFPDLF